MDELCGSDFSSLGNLKRINLISFEKFNKCDFSLERKLHA